MFYALSWFFIVALLALWSLAAWALHGVAVWTASNAEALSVGPIGASALALPDWLAPWVPSELVQVSTQLMASLGPLIDSLLQAEPMLSGGLTVATWVVWGIGSGLLLLLGVAMHLLIALWRRRGGNGAGGAGGTGPHTGRSLTAG